ncbi:MULTISPECIES: hypothetical protein [unclassified Corynebacterium]|uniref:hypothetical protein n=1 Tax=unclassified Corynebacterium TaxID=2624378 RepID=UPI0013047534|nr:MULTISPECIES: hypothetical protein [unclassified Corynebacterium]
MAHIIQHSNHPREVTIKTRSTAALAGTTLALAAAAFATTAPAAHSSAHTYSN